MNAFTPSRYQQAFFDALLNETGDLQLVAVAGSGKTKSIEEAAKRLPAALRSRTLMTAFNSHIAKELQARQKKGDIPSGITISTIHSQGYKVLAKTFEPSDSRNWVDGDKYRKLVDYYWAGLLDQGMSLEKLQGEGVRNAKRAHTEVCRFAMLTLTDPADRAALQAMIDHFGVEIDMEHEERVLTTVAQILRWGREGLPGRDRDGLRYHPKERISFDDMVYLPIALDLSVPSFSLVFCDESQDFNRAQQELILRMRGNQGRIVFVGDPAQAIYSFAGADNESFERIQSITNAKRLPLSICYRCAKAVVREAQQIVPSIEASETAPEGAVVHIEEEKLLELVINHHASKPFEPFMLLCRTNAPLIKSAFQLIARGVPAKVKGRDIGQALIQTIDQFEQMPGYHFDAFPEAAEHYRRLQTLALERKSGSEMQIASMNDKVDSLLAVHTAVVAAGGNTAADMRAKIEGLFSNEDQSITLSSIHKAKGLESKKVGILQAGLLPHPKATAGWQYEQEKNLAYVAMTRAREELYISGWMGFGMGEEAEDAAAGDVGQAPGAPLTPPRRDAEAEAVAEWFIAKFGDRPEVFSALDRRRAELVSR